MPWRQVPGRCVSAAGARAEESGRHGIVAKFLVLCQSGLSGSHRPPASPSRATTFFVAENMAQGLGSHARRTHGHHSARRELRFRSNQGVAFITRGSALVAAVPKRRRLVLCLHDFGWCARWICTRPSCTTSTSSSTLRTCDQTARTRSKFRCAHYNDLYRDFNAGAGCHALSRFSDLKSEISDKSLSSRTHPNHFCAKTAHAFCMSLRKKSASSPLPFARMMRATSCLSDDSQESIGAIANRSARFSSAGALAPSGPVHVFVRPDCAQRSLLNDCGISRASPSNSRAVPLLGPRGVRGFANLKSIPVILPCPHTSFPTNQITCGPPPVCGGFGAEVPAARIG